MSLELLVLTQELQSFPALALEGSTQHKALIMILPAYTLFMAPYYHQEKVSLPSLAFKAWPQSIPAHCSLPSTTLIHTSKPSSKNPSLILVCVSQLLSIIP